MRQDTDRPIVLVTRKTRLEELIVRYNTLEQVRFYITHMGGDFADYETEHACYREAVTKAQRTLEGLGHLQVVDRSFVPNFIFAPQAVVVAVGQDGLVANTLKYLDGQPLIGVNPDPGRWDGILLPFRTEALARLLPAVLAGQRPWREVTLAEVRLNDGQVLYGVNDLFIGQRTHVSARYEIALGTQREQQSSSGIIVSTGLGSTGWLRSIVTGAAAIAGTAPAEAMVHGAAWDAEQLWYTVREPFPSRTTGTSLVFGTIRGDAVLRLRSLMPENGVIFSDGMENDFLTFNAGAEATIRLAKKKGYLVV